MILRQPRMKMSAFSVFGAVASAAPGAALACAPTPLPVVAALIDQAASRFALPPSWLHAVARAESGYASCALSPKGAMGVMQVMPATYGELRLKHGLGADPFHVGDNIIAGAAYLRSLCDAFGAPQCFAAYNAGPARLARHLRGEQPLPSETVRYVAQVTRRLGGGSVALGTSARAQRQPSPPSLFPRPAGADDELFVRPRGERVP